MASPQLEDGYLRVANELYERLFQSCLGGSESALIGLLIRITYGMNMHFAELTSEIIAKHLDINSSNARRTLKSLIEKKFILCKYPPRGTRGGIYQLNKDWEEWITGRRLPWPNLIKECIKNARLEVALDDGKNQKRTASVSKTHGKRIKNARQAYQKRTASDRESSTSVEVEGRLIHEDMKTCKTPPNPQGGGESSFNSKNRNQERKKFGALLAKKFGVTPRAKDVAKICDLYHRPSLPDGQDAISWRRAFLATIADQVELVKAEVLGGKSYGSIYGVAIARAQQIAEVSLQTETTQEDRDIIYTDDWTG